MTNQHLIIEVLQSWNGLTLEKLFRERWKAPKKLVHEWRMSKEVTVNGNSVTWSTILNEGDTISIPLLDHAENETIKAENLGIPILYEDDLLLIANKPAGMDTHPSHPGEAHSLINGVAHHLQKTGQTCMIKHIHRLDKDTTGAVLFAKNRLIGSMLDRMLEEREIKRTYLALVEGNIKKDEGDIKEKIGRDRHHATRRRVSPTGQTAVTHFRVINRDSKKNLTLVSCTLESGRTHQIRVHFSHLNHPLAGDTLYGGKKTFHRQALHARKIEFIHPISELKMIIEAPFIDRPEIFDDHI
ncbi:RNA pseudouridine synthase [Peribacillus simplex NBRC 15720 = DSM 1321]|uniref:Pseudouridine synthase n=1 Tax=Peribacillus simplex NBRC 15720 = DSM 1321 TaxID=1349754 RepID=A0A223EPT6_9BACI|nr:RluA family pseudouridine synthase [Peribacillus simplex]ASS97298.1 RNA pseudouridine synthase [Peribacillus simplex NBRC 15720 = DSM 1321]MEC1396744.1 RluA family pseudouridine synthase [Peribacillus simplex]MED3909752.1 RluA family pseudouridine synthase [Peribacillus simplex]MED3985105.1 RluA family pseudouridine synthase [Peribacillus simplex]MED4093215.1 RluA family pseudouridine synthase [Peribacillus simplex]